MPCRRSPYQARRSCCAGSGAGESGGGGGWGGKVQDLDSLAPGPGPGPGPGQGAQPVRAVWTDCSPLTGQRCACVRAGKKKTRRQLEHGERQPQQDQQHQQQNHDGDPREPSRQKHPQSRFQPSTAIHLAITTRAPHRRCTRQTTSATQQAGGRAGGTIEIRWFRLRESPRSLCSARAGAAMPIATAARQDARESKAEVQAMTWPQLAG